MKRWVVLLEESGRRRPYAYGPIDDLDLAKGFAQFMTTEVDSARVLDLIDPLDELIRFVQRTKAETADRPSTWPPEPGQVWEDRHGDRWVCARHAAPYLFCLACPADDNADEIWRGFGPMKLVQFVGPNQAEEPPF